MNKQNTGSTRELRSGETDQTGAALLSAMLQVGLRPEVIDARLCPAETSAGLRPAKTSAGLRPAITKAGLCPAII